MFGNKDYHLRRTKFIVYQLAMIFCVVSESLGTAVLSGKSPIQLPKSERLVCVPQVDDNDVANAPQQISSTRKITSGNIQAGGRWSTTMTISAWHRTTSSQAFTWLSSSGRRSSSTSSGPRDGRTGESRLLGRVAP